jgi:uncharacterized NAD(P)/FAD-binding protein YdhS
MRDPYHVVVVGGGFSGVSLAAQLLRIARGRLCVTLLESGPKLGRGVAYATPDEQHLLNTRASQMSLLGDDPDHFVRWNEMRGKRVAGHAFATRRSYGDYLDTTLRSLAATRREIAFRAHVDTQVTDVRRERAGFAVVLADGRALSASAVVLATGHPPPADPLASWLPRGAERYVPDPWRHADVERIASTDRVLLIGAGLTMVDLTLTLARRGHAGRIDALSRHGLVPREHAAASQVLPRDLRDSLFAELSRNDLRSAVRAVRAAVAAAESRGLSWHAVMDALRPVTPRLWSAMCAADRQRFVARLRTFWDVHRHRLPSEPAKAIAELRAAGRLAVNAGRIRRAAGRANAVTVDIALRGGSVVRERYDWVINCTGSSFTRANSRGLERLLLERGLLLVDPLGLGYVTEANGAVFGALGPVRGLYVLGPACRAQCWENTAVPELRKQADALATELTRAAAR